jgi:hypothetical protein
MLSRRVDFTVLLYDIFPFFHILSFQRTSLNGSEHLLCVQNISNKSHEIDIDLTHLPSDRADSEIDVISGQRFSVVKQELYLHLAPYQIFWLVDSG